MDINKLHCQHYHLSEQILKLQYPEVANQTLRKCVACVRSKSHRSAIKKKAAEDTQPTKPLDVVSSDLKMMPCEGKGRAKYIGTAIDKKTRFTVLVYLRTKGEWHKKYEDIITWFKSQKGQTHKQWRTDGGGEFCNKHTDAINNREGIQHSIGPPYTPKRNGVPERFNKTMSQGTNSMLLHAGNPKRHWVQCSGHFMVMKNRTKHRSLKWRSPYELFYKRQPHKMDYGTWGCLAMVHVNKEKRSKKEIDLIIPCCYMGLDNSGRYHCTTFDEKKEYVTDSITFIHNIFPLGKHAHLMKYDLDQVLKMVTIAEGELLKEVKLTNEKFAETPLAHGTSPVISPGPFLNFEVIEPIADQTFISKQQNGGKQSDSESDDDDSDSGGTPKETEGGEEGEGRRTTDFTGLDDNGGPRNPHQEGIGMLVLIYCQDFL